MPYVPGVTELILAVGVPMIETGTGAAIDRARERLRADVRPVNHDLLRASRASYLLATRELCLACLEARGATRARRKGLAALLRLRRDSGEFKPLIQRLENELKFLKDTDLVWPDPDLDGRYEHLVQPRGEGPAAQVEELKVALKARVLDELESWRIEPPTIFRERLEHGWEEPGSDKLDWFDLVSGFFCQELKENDRVRTSFFAELQAVLPEIHTEVQAVHRQLEEYAQVSLPLIERFDSRLEELFRHQHEQFSLLHRGLAKSAGEAAARDADLKEAVREVRRLILQTTRAPIGDPGALEALVADYRWRGVLVADDVLKLLSEYLAGSFAGRDADLDALNRFVTDRPSGRLVVTAPPGYGKTTLLANWITGLEELGACPVYHFFSTHYQRLNRIINCYRHLVRQLRVYHGDAGEPPETPEALEDEIYRLVREDRPGEKLVIVLDGLDEAETQVEDPFGHLDLPVDVYVVVSGKTAGHGDESPRLAEWIRRADERLHLRELPREANAELLEDSLDEGVAQYARDEVFVDEVAAKTEGVAIHADYLIQDLEHAGGADLRSVVARTPVGFSAYVQQQADELFSGRAELRDAFAVLAAALGPLARQELSEVAGLVQGQTMGDQDLADLRSDWRVRRWLHIGGDEASGLESYAFAHPYVGQAFGESLGDRTAVADRVLLDWCADWTGKPYALRHYAGHLLDAVPEQHEGFPAPPVLAREKLYSLARDSSFRDQQLAAFPAEPDLQLRTLQLALLAAAKTDDAGAMAEFLLLHAKRIGHLRESPLDELERLGVDGARGQADLAPLDASVVWHLLIAWRLLSRDDFVDAGATLDVLLRKDIRRLTGDHEVVAACVLAEFATNDLAQRLVDRLLGDRGRVAFVRQLAGRAGALRARGDHDSSSRLLQLGLAAADRLQDDGVRSQLLKDVAADLEAAEVDARGPTRETAEYVFAPEPRVSALIAAAQAAGESEDPDRAADILTAARQFAVGYGQIAEWNRAFAILREQWEWRSASSAEPLPDEPFTAEIEQTRAWAARLAGESPDASAELERAIANGRVDPQAMPSYLAGIAWVQADLGDVEGSLSTFARAADAARRVNRELRPFVLVAVAGAAAEAGARAKAADIFDTARLDHVALHAPADRAYGLAVLAKRAGSAGFDPEAARDFEAATEAATQVTGLLPRVSILLHVARCSSAEARAAALTGARRAARAEGDMIERLKSIQMIVDESSRDELGLSPDAEAWADAGLDPLEDAFYLLMTASTQSARESERPQAVATLRRAQEVARSVDTANERTWFLGVIALALAELGAVEEAGNAFAVARDEILGLEEELFRKLTLASLAFVEARANRFDGAFGTVELIEDPEVETFAFWGLSAIQAEHGLVRDAVDTLRRALARSQEIPEVEDAGLALAAIADGSGKAARTFGYARAELEMKQHDWRLDAGGEGPVAQAAVLRRTALASGDVGEPDLAAATLEKARDAARDIDSPIDRARFLSAIAHSAATVRRPELAEATFELALDQTAVLEDPAERAAGATDIAWTAKAAAAEVAYEAADEAAWTAALEVDETHLRVAILLALAGSRAYARKLGPVLQALSAATDEGASASDRDVEAVLLLAVARVQARVGLDEDARSTLSRAWTAARELDAPRRGAYAVAIPLIPLPPPLPESGDEARIEFRRRAVNLLVEIARAEAELHGDGQDEATIEAARKLVEEIQDEEVKEGLLQAIEQRDARAPEPASRQDAPLSVGPPAGDPLADAVAGDPLADAVAAVRAGNADPAIAGFARVLAKSPPESDLSTWALAAIARTQARTGEVEAAARTAGTIRDAQARRSALADVKQLEGAAGAPIEQPAPDRPLAVDVARQAIQRADDGQTSPALEGQRAMTRTLLARASAKQILSLGGRHFLREAARCAREDPPDRDGFESNLVPCAYHPEVVAEVCALLAGVYPRQADEVVAAVRRFATASGA